MIGRAVTWLVAVMVTGSVLALLALMTILIVGNVVVTKLEAVLP